MLLFFIYFLFLLKREPFLCSHLKNKIRVFQPGEKLLIRVVLCSFFFASCFSATSIFVCIYMCRYIWLVYLHLHAFNPFDGQQARNRDAQRNTRVDISISITHWQHMHILPSNYHSSLTLIFGIMIVNDSRIYFFFKSYPTSCNFFSLFHRTFGNII